MLNLEVFNLREQSNIITLIKKALEEGYTLETLYSKLEVSINSERKKIELNNRIRFRQHKKLWNIKVLCRKCKEPSVELQPVNTNPRNQIGEGYKIALQCVNENCLHTEYSRLSVERLLEQTRQEYLRNELQGKK